MATYTDKALKTFPSTTIFKTETVICPQCGAEYTPSSSQYVKVNGAKIPQCPECGTINVTTVQTEPEEEECDFDENEANQE